MNVLTLKIDQAAQEKKFRLHPRCQALSLTYLCFADDLMVFVEGSKESIEGALAVFYEFEYSHSLVLVWRNLLSIWLEFRRLRRVES